MHSSMLATATPEQVQAAKDTIKLANLIENFIEQSHKVEVSNKRLTGFVIILSITQVAVAIITLIK